MLMRIVCKKDRKCTMWNNFSHYKLDTIAPNGVQSKARSIVSNTSQKCPKVEFVGEKRVAACEWVKRLLEKISLCSDDLRMPWKRFLRKGCSPIVTCFNAAFSASRKNLLRSPFLPNTRRKTVSQNLTIGGLCSYEVNRLTKWHFPFT